MLAPVVGLWPVRRCGAARTPPGGNWRHEGAGGETPTALTPASGPWPTLAEHEQCARHDGHATPPCVRRERRFRRDKSRRMGPMRRRTCASGVCGLDHRGRGQGVKRPRARTPRTFPSTRGPGGPGPRKRNVGGHRGRVNGRPGQPVDGDVDGLGRAWFQSVEASAIPVDRTVDGQTPCPVNSLSPAMTVSRTCGRQILFLRWPVRCRCG